MGFDLISIYPEQYIQEYGDLCEMIAFHAEASGNPYELIEMIKRKNNIVLGSAGQAKYIK